jgi:hypothetical protein
MARGHWIALTLPLALAALFFASTPGEAQKTTLPEYYNKVSSDPKVIVSQIQMGLELEKKALAAFEAAGPADDLTEAHLTASNAYVAIRAARDGLFGLKGRKKLADPVLLLAYEKTNAAWNRSRGPVDHMPPMGSLRAGYLTTSIRQMNEVIAWLEQVLLMWP